MTRRNGRTARWLGALTVILGGGLAVPAVAQQTEGGSVLNTDLEPVTYDDILENPDDIDLNIRYARTLIGDGRLDQAAITLERILIINPGLDRVRVLYGIVLYRLDNLVEAKQELQTVLDDGDLDSGLKDQAETYLARIQRRQQNVSGAVTVGAGVHVDTNRNSFPEGGEFRFFDDVDEFAGDENTDWGQIAFAKGRVNYDPGAQRVTNLYAEATTLVDNQAQEDDLDILAGFAEIGGTVDATALQITPHLRYEHLDVGGAKYAQIPEIGVRLSRTAHAIHGLNLFLENRLSYEEYNNTFDLPFNTEQNGLRYELEGGAGYNVSNAWRVEGSYRYTFKDSDDDFERYAGHRLRASTTYVFDYQGFVTGTASVEYQDYDGPEAPIISSTKVREDVDSRVRVTYGVPVGAILMAAGRENPAAATKNLVLSLTGEYFNSESNINNFDYDNWRGSFLVSKRFEF
jgi:tetratricopeptide (TPR) repeat protein